MKSLACLALLFSLATVLVAQTPAAPKAPVAKRIESAVFDWNDLKVEQRPNGERRAAGQLRVRLQSGQTRPQLG